jgi:signal transduction histidine kinase
VARTAFASGAPHVNQFRWIAKDGRALWVEARATIIHDEAGNPVGMRGVTFDITERKHIEQERAQLLVREQAARAEIERASGMKDEFLAMLSHELRTPLNAVLGYTQLLSSGVVPPKRAAHAIDVIQRNARAQLRLVESLLDLSRIIAGKLDLELEAVDLSSAVESAADVIRPDAEVKGIQLEVVVPSSPLAITGDRGRLQQVLWNLLSNAVKYTPHGGRVGIHVTEVTSQVHIRITDSGEGISAEFLPYVFDRFKQADTAKRRAPGGLGLGLTLVREMVQAHGGTVVAESGGEGQGSTFTVTMPLSVPARTV